MEKIECKFLLVLLFTGIVSCAGTRIYDHLKLSLVWPNSYCWTNNIQCRTSIPQYFVVKSLWAESAGEDPQQLTSCKPSSELSDDVILGQKLNLLKYWPDLRTYNYEISKKMWKEEWKNYGSCMADAMTPESYLSTTLNLRQNHNMYQILKSAGIVANGNSYTADKIISAIKKATKFTPDIICESDTEGNVFLSEIHQCIDKDGKTFRDCQHAAEKCDKDPIFPDPNYG